MKRLYDRLLGLNDAVFLQIVITWYLVGIGVVVALLEVILTRNASGLGLNLSTELIGGALTYVLLSVIVGRQFSQEAERRAIEQEKRRLILQMGSPDRGFAVEAARILKMKGWGFGNDTTLHGANLEAANLEEALLFRVNLQNAYLGGANLEGASLGEANLQRVSLLGANLQGADLYGANLQGAHLFAANLQGVDLLEANLQGALLNGANLQGADLRGVNLEGALLNKANLQEVDLLDANLQKADLEGAELERADLEGARLGEETILPDSTLWTPDTDMARFTDSDHPNFWCSDNPSSLNYRGGG
jgi:uncharacterized protein YjbI with pentapeptide repeats